MKPRIACLALLIGLLGPCLALGEEPGATDYRAGIDALAEDAPAQAAKHLRRAAERGHASAAFRLGALYEEGRGVASDPEAAVRWYRRAAAGDDARAFFNLAHMYAQGKGVAADAGKAAQWYERAAQGGNAHAQYALGLLYNRGGTGLEQDLVAAWFWLTVASDNFGPNAFRDTANRVRSAVGERMDEAELAAAKRRVGEWHARTD